MKLEFLFVPTSDLDASLTLFRDLGFTEAWREGGATVALDVPGSGVKLMLDAHDPDAPPGPVFVVTTFRSSTPNGRTHSPFSTAPRRSRAAPWSSTRIRAV